MEDQVRMILDDVGRLPVAAATLDRQADLHAAGLTSLATVHVMLAIEQEFDIEFPDEMLTRRTFGSIAALAEVVEHLQARRAA